MSIYDAAQRLGRSFVLFQSGAFLLSVGTRCHQIAVAWWVLDSTSSPSIFAAFVAIAGAAEVISRPIFGWMGDFYNRKRCFLTINLIGLGAALGCALLALFALFQSYLVAALLVILGIVAGIRDPLSASILPALVSRDQVSLAVQTRTLFVSIAMLIGPAIAGALLATQGVTFALLANVFALLVSTILISRVRIPSNQSAAAEKEPATYLRQWSRKISSGFVVLYRVRTECYLALLAMGSIMCVYPLFGVLVPVLLNDELNTSPLVMSILDAAFCAGMLLGSGLLVKQVNRRVGRARGVYAGFFALGASLILTSLLSLQKLDLSVMQIIVLIVPAMLIGGVGLTLVNVNTATVRTLATPDAFRNRMMATVSFFVGLTIPIGSALAGQLSDWCGAPRTIGL